MITLTKFYVNEANLGLNLDISDIFITGFGSDITIDCDLT